MSDGSAFQARGSAMENALSVTWFVCRQCAVTSIDLQSKKRGSGIVFALHKLSSVV